MKDFIGWFIVSLRPPKEQSCHNQLRVSFWGHMCHLQVLIRSGYVPRGAPRRAGSHFSVTTPDVAERSLPSASCSCAQSTAHCCRCSVKCVCMCLCVNTKLGNYRGNEMCLFKLSAELWLLASLNLRCWLVWWESLSTATESLRSEKVHNLKALHLVFVWHHFRSNKCPTPADHSYSLT